MNEKNLNSLFLLNNIRELKLDKCNIHGRLNSWAESFTKIEVFEIVTDLCYQRVFYNNHKTTLL